MVRYIPSIWFILCLLFIAPAALAQHGVPGQGLSTQNGKFTFLTADMVKEAMAGQHKPVLIDVGSIQEYRGAHIPGAVNIPSVAIKAQPQRLPKDKSAWIIIYQGRGEGGQERAHQTAVTVLKLGYKQVSVFMGGLPDWMDKKYPIKKGAKP